MRDLCSVIDVSVFGIQVVDLFSAGEEEDQQLQELIAQLASTPDNPTHRTMWDEPDGS